MKGPTFATNDRVTELESRVSYLEDQLFRLTSLLTNATDSADKGTKTTSLPALPPSKLSIAAVRNVKGIVVQGIARNATPLLLENIKAYLTKKLPRNSNLHVHVIYESSFGRLNLRDIEDLKMGDVVMYIVTDHRPIPDEVNRHYGVPVFMLALDDTFQDVENRLGRPKTRENDAVMSDLKSYMHIALY